jgi:hypothetical protein
MSVYIWQSTTEKFRADSLETENLPAELPDLQETDWPKGWGP